MSGSNRIVALVVEVSDLLRSAKLYREGFGIALKPAADHEGSDRWTSGPHCAVSWTEGAFFHFALYETKGDVTRSAQIGISVPDVDAACAAAVEAGAELIHAPKKQPWGRGARLLDYDGNVIELTES